MPISSVVLMSRSASRSARRHRLVRLAGGLLLLMLLGQSVVGCQTAPSTRGMPLVVAASPEPEQQMLAALTMVLLRDQGYTVIPRTDLKSTWHVRQALEAGSVSVAWQDTSTVWFTFLGHDRPETSEVALYRQVKAEDYTHGIVWLSPLPWSTRQTIVVRAKTANENRLESIGDLAVHVGSTDPYMTICLPQESINDTRALAGLQRVYGFSFRTDSVKAMPADEALQAVLDGSCDSTIGTAKDVAPFQGKLVTLRDNKAFFSASNLAPTLHVKAYNQYPELERIIGSLTNALDEATLAALESEARTSRTSYERLAERYLKSVSLVD